MRATVCPISASTSSQLPTSVLTKLAAPPERAMSLRVDLAALDRIGGDIRNHDRGAFAAKPMAMARPMPELAPVTTATFPSSRGDMCWRGYS
jgi:hypothetical protein